MASEFADKAYKIRQGEEPDIASLETYLRQHLPDWSGSLEIQQFPRGFSNLTYLIKDGERQYVLRRPPFGANIKSAHDMGREFTILSGLKDVYGKVPKPLVYCEDEEIIGAPFYVMERVSGIILRPQMPEEMHPSPKLMRAIAEALVDGFSELHQVDYQKAGLENLGKPEGYVRRQIEGWTRRYFKAKTDEVKEVEAAAEWLGKNMPAESGISLIHNDFKYDNIVLDPVDWSKVIAVLDWEMATIGDPLMDLGTSLGYWMDPDDPPGMLELQLSPTTLPGNPSRAEIAQWYAQKSGKDLNHLLFYYVYGLFKIAVIVQQIYARYKLGYTQDPRFAKLDQAVRGCGIMAMQAISRNRIDKLFS